MVKAEDSDVSMERARVSQLMNDKIAVKVDSLNKYYGSLKAVDSLTFATDVGECFGLLGLNGAGKTSTLKMLTGELPIDNGRVQIFGKSVAKHWRTACSSVGYCPQFDTCLKNLTGRETLSILARIRGVVQVKRTVQSVVRSIGLDEHVDNLVGTYSGGNRRRLSVGLAMIGWSKVVILDEPTAGIDPRARRLVWNTISERRSRGIALILSSHNMDECEALCTKVGIMVAGRLMCLGPIQHIKSKFGHGATLTLKLPSVSDTTSALELVARLLPSATLKEQHLSQLEFSIDQSEPWSTLFIQTDRLAVQLKLIDYSLSQCTLEQAFLRLSRTALFGDDQ